MAEDVLGKTIDQLKKERTIAKSCFTRRANYLTRKADTLYETELREEYTKLSADARRVIETNDDVRTGLLAEIEASAADVEEAQLDENQETNLEKVATDCEERLDEVKRLVQNNIWPKYGQDVVEAAFKAAEKACQDGYNIPVESINCESFEVHLLVMEKLIKEASKALSDWEPWIPTAEASVYKKDIKNMKSVSNEHELRKADFARARRLEFEKKVSAPVDVKTDIPRQVMPLVKIKPTKLPTFNGCKREFHRWKKDWVSLQRQGEPTGSQEVKKVQLLDSVDEKMAKDLRLSTYNTADDIFRVLENRYGNKTTIAIEIIEELEKIPPVRGNQPRKVVDLIQTVEKALSDLTDLGNTGALKNPLVVKSIESKLPEFVKKDWLVFMVEAENNVTQDNHFDMLLAFLKKQEDIFERLDHLKIVEKSERSDKAESKFNKKYASTRTTKKDDTEGGCIICGEEKHKDRIFFCKKFKALKLSEKETAVKKIGACRKCLECHKNNDDCKHYYL